MTSNFVKVGLIVVIILLIAILGAMTGFVTKPITEMTTTTSISVGPVVRFWGIYCDDLLNIRILVKNQGTSDLTTSSIVWLKDGVIQSGASCETGIIKPGDRGNCTIAGNTAGKTYNIVATLPGSESWKGASEIVGC